MRNKWSILSHTALQDLNTLSEKMRQLCGQCHANLVRSHTEREREREREREKERERDRSRLS